MTNAIELSVFSSRLNAICEEMGATLRRAAFSPNIKDRLDFSCAVFDERGQICAQAAHIPVHLGSMAYAMTSIVSAVSWQPGDVLIVNDPYRGGTHLPDVTVIAPLFVNGELSAFAVNRAHHANIGAHSPGSMPIAAKLEEEGVVIAPTHLVKAGVWQDAVLARVCGKAEEAGARGDFLAQVSSVQLGVKRLQELLANSSRAEFLQTIGQLNAYGEALAREYWRKIPRGSYCFTDFMDGDGFGNLDIPITVTLQVSDTQIVADFTGTSAQVTGNINCPLAVAAAAVFYCFRCLLPDFAPSCAGLFKHLKISAPEATLVNARYPAAVAAGNVETSSRIVDVVFGALAQALPTLIPAASQGTMNNLAMGNKLTEEQSNQGPQRAWDYYETIAGGGGASAQGAGLSARHSHMTNTLNTPIESMEAHYPVRVHSYSLRSHSGGSGHFRGGDGVVKQYVFNGPAQVTLLTERRRHQPWGMHGAAGGSRGVNSLNGETLPDKTSIQVQPGDILTIESPGGGGWNSPE